MGNSPKANKAYKSLNEFSNIIKNNSVGKFNSDDMGRSSKKSDSYIGDFINNETSDIDIDIGNEQDFYDSNINDDIFMKSDPPLLHPELINRVNYLNKSSKSNKIINIT